VEEIFAEKRKLFTLVVLLSSDQQRQAHDDARSMNEDLPEVLGKALGHSVETA
jgi:hypothetical protein